MSMCDKGLVHEPFGPEYVRPKNQDCPDCECCTAALCEKGRASISECAGHVDDEDLIEQVTDCPCSAEATPGTLSWRAGMIRATTFATERPLRADLETLLMRISVGTPHGDLAVLLPKLTVRRYVSWRPGTEPEVTDFGWAYIRARWGRRTTSDVSVVSVDFARSTAQVVVTEFSDEKLVTVPMEQALNSRTGLTIGDFTGRLCAEANVDVLDADKVVLTKVRNPALAAGSDGGR